MTLFDIIKPDEYPLMVTVGSCVVLLLIMIAISYRRVIPTVSAVFLIGSFIFMHLDLVSYTISYHFMNRFLSIFNFEQMMPSTEWMIRLTGYLILTVVPFFIWLIPMVMLDEHLTEELCESDRTKFLKTTVLAVVGIFVNLFFVRAILQ